MASSTSAQTEIKPASDFMKALYECFFFVY